VTEFATNANRAAIDGASAVFRTLVLINGGAAVSVLAFVGGLISQGELSLGAQAAGVTRALLLFALGVLASALGVAFAYFTNLAVAGHALSDQTVGAPLLGRIFELSTVGLGIKGFRLLAIISGIGAAALFLCGVLEVSHAITESAVHLPAERH
jgi:hypothetical protein